MKNYSVSIHLEIFLLFCTTPPSTVSHVPHILFITHSAHLRPPELVLLRVQCIALGCGVTSESHPTMETKKVRGRNPGFGS